MKERIYMIDTILLDFDGTLMNTREGIIKSWQYLFKKVRGLDVDEEFLKDTFGEPLMTSLERFFPDIAPEESIEIYRDYQRQHHEAMMKPFDGVVKTVKALKDKGVKIALVTSRGSKSSMEGLEMCGMLNCFDALVTADKCEKHKPEPEPILMALKLLNAKKENTLMVGDTRFDLISAKKAGVCSVLVGWSEELGELKESKEYAPDFVIEKAEDIFDILERE